MQLLKFYKLRGGWTSDMRRFDQLVIISNHCRCYEQPEHVRMTEGHVVT